MPLFKCSVCSANRSPFKPFCQHCNRLFEIVKENLGTMGLGQLIDTLIATGIPKNHVKVFLEKDQPGRGSIMDQITASLTNNLAEGIGVKGSEMTAEDVRRIRLNPVFGSSTKPIDK